MDEPVNSRFPSRFSWLLLGGLTAWLLILRPGQLAPSRPYSDVFLIVNLAGLYVLYLVSWKSHGLIYSIASILIFLLSDRPSIDFSEVAIWQLNQICFLICLGLHLIVWSELNTARKSAPFWVIVSVSLFASTALLWIEAEYSWRRFAAHPNEGWSVANQRIRICTWIVLIGGGILAVCCRARRNPGAWIWLAACLVAPAAGLGIAHLYLAAQPEHLLAGGNWDRLVMDFVRWFERPDLNGAIEGWCWTTPSVVLPLMLIGLWRTVARGFRQRRRGMMPVAWLVFLSAVLLAIALVPVSSETLRPLGLCWLGIALSVFAVADLALMIYERMALEAPPTGPSDVPHVGLPSTRQS